MEVLLLLDKLSFQVQHSLIFLIKLKRLGDFAGKSTTRFIKSWLENRNIAKYSKLLSPELQRGWFALRVNHLQKKNPRTKQNLIRKGFVLSRVKTN